MTKDSQFKLGLSVIGLAVILVYLGFYARSINLKNSQLNLPKAGSAKKAPYKTITPETGFLPGTTISLYTTTPPGFPEGVILENKPLSHSSSVNTPDGKKLISVSYISDKTSTNVAELYLASLPKAGWFITSKHLATAMPSSAYALSGSAPMENPEDANEDETKPSSPPATTASVIQASLELQKIVLTITPLTKATTTSGTLVTFQYTQ